MAQIHMRPRDFGPKPKGLWVSDEDEYGWREWCTEESFGIERLAIEHEVALAEDNRVLMINDECELDAFTERYGARVDPEDFTHYYWIDWPAVASSYQGIIITPYIGSRRMTSHTSWYYPWDVASGCIWDSDAVASIKIVESA